MQQNQAQVPEKNEKSGWIGTIILLLIPFLRPIGVFMLIRKVAKLFGVGSKQMKWVTLLSILAICGVLGDVLGYVEIILLISAALGVCGWGAYRIFKKSEVKLSQYSGCLANNDSYDLDLLIRQMGVSETTLRKDLALLKKKGILPKEAFIDESKRLLVIHHAGNAASNSAAQAASRNPFAGASDFHKDAEKQAAKNEDPDIASYRDTLLEIRALNIAIEDDAVSAKIDRIEELTRNIFELVIQRPERKNDIQNFLEYYLPTTLKLLRQYARLENTTGGGENIDTSRRKIEDILENLVHAYEKQLDQLFKSDAIDISSDIKVLEKMMQMDGLNR